MSMYTLLRNHPAPKMEEIEDAFQGNLCRCTGYRPILEGYRTFAKDGGCCGGKVNDFGCCMAGKENKVLGQGCCGKKANGAGCCMDGKDDHAGLITSNLFNPSEFQPLDPTQEPIFPPELLTFPHELLVTEIQLSHCIVTTMFDQIDNSRSAMEHQQQLSTTGAPGLGLMEIDEGPGKMLQSQRQSQTQNNKPQKQLCFKGERVMWFQPSTLRELVALKAQYPSAKLVVGNTEVGIEMRLKNMLYPVIIAPTWIPEMNSVQHTNEGISFGASCTLRRMEEVLQKAVAELPRYKSEVFQAVLEQLRWFAGPQIRNVAAVGGNIMTASPISDLNPVFMASGSKLTLESNEGSRTIKMDETFFTSYRKTILKPQEILVSIEIPFSRKSKNSFCPVATMCNLSYKAIERAHKAMGPNLLGPNLLLHAGLHAKASLTDGCLVSVWESKTALVPQLDGQTWLIRKASLALQRMLSLPSSEAGRARDIRYLAGQGSDLRQGQSQQRASVEGMARLEADPHCSCRKSPGCRRRAEWPREAISELQLCCEIAGALQVPTDVILVLQALVVCTVLLFTTATAGELCPSGKPAFLASAALCICKKQGKHTHSELLEQTVLVPSGEICLSRQEISKGITEEFAPEPRTRKGLLVCLYSVAPTCDQAFKQASRREDDIAIVTCGLRVLFQEGTDRVKEIKLSYGGMAPTTVLAVKTCQELVGREWKENLLQEACHRLAGEMNLSPSAPGGMVDFRRTLVLSFFFKFYLTVLQKLHSELSENNNLGDMVPSSYASATELFRKDPINNVQLFQEVPPGQSVEDTVGRPLVHLSAGKQASGEAVYCDDIPHYENELYLTLVTSTKAHAKIVSIDATEAQKVPGFVCFVSAEDVPGSNVTGIANDETVFAKDTATCVGHIIGGVLADTQEHSRRAARAVKITYEDLPPIVTIQEAIEKQSFFETDRTIVKGNIEKGFQEADHIVEGEMYLGGQEHFYLETHCTIAVPKGEDGEMELFVSTQNLTKTQEFVAKALGVPSNRIVVRVKRMGGGFGGKETRNTIVSTAVAVAAVKVGCPVRCMLDRDEDMLISGGRHPFLGQYKVGFKKNGRITSLDVTYYSNGGNSVDLSHGDLIVDERADLVCITETWAGGGDVALSQLCPPGYLVQHCSRPEGRGGGVALVYRASIHFTGLPVPSRPGLECLYLVLGNRDRLGILLVYRAPFCPTVSLPELMEIISDLVLRTPRMLVLGDFNLHAETGLTGAAQDFMASMTAMGLSQHVTGPTHERGHTLDLVFSTEQEEGGLRVSNLCLTPLSWSDHFLVRFVLESDFSLCKGVDPIVWVCPRSRMDPEGFLKALGEFPADKTGAPVEALVELWNGEMNRAVDMIAPKRPLPPGRARSSPWYTPELRAMKQVGRRLERRWRKSRDESDRTHLRAHYRAYAVAVRAVKKRFFSASIASSQCRPAELFRVVQGLVRPGPKEDLIPPSKARCDDFARHFREKIAQIRHELDTTIDSEVSKETPTLPSGPDLLDEFQLLWPDDVDKVLGRVRPTTCLLDPCPSWLINDSKHGIGTWILEVVNASLREGWVPAPLKEAVVQPVLKKASLDPEMATNYRPVANIPFLGKVLERVVAGQIQALLDETDYLDPLQSGFRPGLAGLGVGGTALQWFRSYLNGRFQKVVLGDYGSAPWQLCHGVPQGSILSPLLFNIYMKPLGEVIRRCGLRSHQYADDTQLYLSFSTNPGEAVAVLNRCLAEVMGWMRANKLKLNPDKTEVLLVGGSGFGEGELNLVLNGVALPLRDKARSLGVLLDPELSLEAQVMDRAVLHMDNTYNIPNLRGTGIVCKTNLSSNTAFRGFGGPQGMMIAECWMSDIALKCGLPAEEVRKLNLYNEGDLTHFDQKLEGFTVPRCLEECLRNSDYHSRRKLIDEFNKQNRWKKRGMAIIPTKFGISFTVPFLNQAGALVHVYTDGSVLLTHGGTEMGQGLHTKMIQVASRALAIPTSKIHISETSTNTVPNASPTAASVSSDINGMAVLNACQTILKRLEPMKSANPKGSWEDWVCCCHYSVCICNP
ncbi:Xanthine dehydrogenase/oxidase [Varanus komodoensis]|nr:Xanthine dehydrogenase/oxidase [Varanus komodoensis]